MGDTFNFVRYDSLTSSLAGLTLTDTYSMTPFPDSSETSDYVETVHFISDTEFIGVGKELPSSMSTGSAYAFSGTYEWRAGRGRLTTVSDDGDYRTLSTLLFDSQTTGSSEVIGSNDYASSGIFELSDMEPGFAPSDLEHMTLTVDKWWESPFDSEQSSPSDPDMTTDPSYLDLGAYFDTYIFHENGLCTTDALNGAYGTYDYHYLRTKSDEGVVVLSITDSTGTSSVVSLTLRFSDDNGGTLNEISSGTSQDWPFQIQSDAESSSHEVSVYATPGGYATGGGPTQHLSLIHI